MNDPLQNPDRQKHHCSHYHMSHYHERSLAASFDCRSQSKGIPHHAVGSGTLPSCNPQYHLYGCNGPVTARMTAKPRSRSAIRSPTSSNPMWKRTVGPPGFHVVAVRNAAQSNGIARLSNPPHEAPIPNSVSALMNACAALSGIGLSTMLNSPDAPVKSRFQMA